MNGLLQSQWTRSLLLIKEHFTTTWTMMMTTKGRKWRMRWGASLYYYQSNCCTFQSMSNTPCLFVDYCHYKTFDEIIRESVIQWSQSVRSISGKGVLLRVYSLVRWREEAYNRFTYSWYSFVDVHREITEIQQSLSLSLIVHSELFQSRWRLIRVAV